MYFLVFRMGYNGKDCCRKKPHISTSIPGWVYIQRYLLFKYAKLITEEKRGFP